MAAETTAGTLTEGLTHDVLDTGLSHDVLDHVMDFAFAGAMAGVVVALLLGAGAGLGVLATLGALVLCAIGGALLGGAVAYWRA
jgi:hypothetical protein